MLRTQQLLSAATLISLMLAPVMASAHTTFSNGSTLAFSWWMLFGLGVVLGGHLIKTDQELVRRVCEKGDQQALLSLIQRNKGTIQALAYRYGHGQEEVEDLQQDLFLLLLDKLTGREAPRNFKAWLSTLIRNRLIDTHRHQQTEQRYESYAKQGPSSYDSGLDTQLDEHQFINQVLHCLQNREREVISRYYLEGQTYQDIAADLNYSFKQVTGLMYRGMKRLRQEMAGCQAYYQS